MKEQKHDKEVLENLFRWFGSEPFLVRQMSDDKVDNLVDLLGSVDI